MHDHTILSNFGMMVLFRVWCLMRNDIKFRLYLLTNEFRRLFYFITYIHQTYASVWILTIDFKCVFLYISLCHRCLRKTTILADLKQHHYKMHILIINLDRIGIHKNEKYITNQIIFYKYSTVNNSISVYRRHFGTQEAFFDMRISEKVWRDRLECRGDMYITFVFQLKHLFYVVYRFNLAMWP